MKTLNVFFFPKQNEGTIENKQVEINKSILYFLGLGMKTWIFKQ